MSKQTYPDLWIRLVGALLLAHFIKILGYSESLWRIVIEPNYPLEIGLGGLINFGIWSAVRWISQWLDARYDWLQQALLRSLLQLALGFVLWMLVAFVVMSFFFQQVVGESIFQSNWLYVEFRVVLFYLLMINLYYLGFYCYQRFRAAEAELQALRAQVLVEPSPEPKAAVLTAPPLLIASKGNRQIPVPLEEIAYCFLQQEVYLLKTFDEQQLMTSQSLDELAQLLPSNQFFRLNRQYLANVKACTAFRNIAHGKLELSLVPPTSEPVIVSQKKAAAFKNWLVNR